MWRVMPILLNFSNANSSNIVLASHQKRMRLYKKNSRKTQQNLIKDLFATRGLTLTWVLIVGFARFSRLLWSSSDSLPEEDKSSLCRLFTHWLFSLSKLPSDEKPACMLVAWCSNDCSKILAILSLENCPSAQGSTLVVVVFNDGDSWLFSLLLPCLQQGLASLPD